MRGLPFSAKVELETVSQLQDGTLITHKTYNLDARDSAGRTHNEMRNWITAEDEEPKLTRVELYDPVTKTRTDLFPLTKWPGSGWLLPGRKQLRPPERRSRRRRAKRLELTQ